MCVGFLGWCFYISSRCGKINLNTENSAALFACKCLFLVRLSLLLLFDRDFDNDLTKD